MSDQVGNQNVGFLMTRLIFYRNDPILNFRTGRFEQQRISLIRIIHYLPFHLASACSAVITVRFSGVRIFRNFMIIVYKFYW